MKDSVRDGKRKQTQKGDNEEKASEKTNESKAEDVGKARSTAKYAKENGNGFKRTLLSEFRLALLDGGNEHSTNGSAGQSSVSTTNTLHGDDVQVLSTSVISAVENSALRESYCGSELVANGTRAT